MVLNDGEFAFYSSVSLNLQHLEARRKDGGAAPQSVAPTGPVLGLQAKEWPGQCLLISLSMVCEKVAAGLDLVILGWPQ